MPRSNKQLVGPLAVLLVDMQVNFVKHLSPRNLARLMEAQTRIIRECANRNIPLIVLELAGYGRTAKELRDEIEKVPRVICLRKEFNGGFKYTGLHRRLQKLGIRSLVIMGMNASYCVSSTVATAIRLKYRIVTTNDLVADSEAVSSRIYRALFRQHGPFPASVPPLLAAIKPALRRRRPKK
jgi:nicotinamidase-related amidase